MNRQRRNGASDLFKQKAEVGDGEGLAAHILGQAKREPAEFRELLPQALRKTAVAAFALPDQCRIALAFQKLGGGLLDLDFLRVKQYVHACLRILLDRIEFCGV